MKHPAVGAAPSGVQGIVHVSMLEEVIKWVLAGFSICRLCAAPEAVTKVTSLLHRVLYKPLYI